MGAGSVFLGWSVARSPDAFRSRSINWLAVRMLQGGHDIRVKALSYEFETVTQIPKRVQNATSLTISNHITKRRRTSLQGDNCCMDGPNTCVRESSLTILLHGS